MNPTNCPSLQKSLSWCEGAPSHPGIRRRVYFCNKNQIVSYPTLKRDSLGRPTSAVLQGNFELQADAYWQFLDINIDKSTVKSDPQGERPSQTQLNKGTFLHNGVGPDATAAASWLNNSDNVYVYEDMIGRFRVLGNNKWATTSKVTQDQGQGTNPASTLIEVEVTDEMAAPFYNGTLETIDGEVSPETEAFDEDSDTEPYVNSKNVTVMVDQQATIDFGPKDGKWSFTSSSPRSVSVDGATGVLHGNFATTNPVTVTCVHDGETIATVNVTVIPMEGEDPGGGVDPDEPSADTPTVSPKALYLLGNETGLLTPSPLDFNWEMLIDSEFITISKHTEYQQVTPGMQSLPTPTGKFIVIPGSDSGFGVIHAIHGDSLVNIPVVTLIFNQFGDDLGELDIYPGGTIEFDLMPQSGWQAQTDTGEVTIEDGHVTFVANEEETEGVLTLTNANGDSIEIPVRVSGDYAG